MKLCCAKIPSIFNRYRLSSFFCFYMIHVVRAGLLMKDTKGGYLQTCPLVCVCILSGTKGRCYKKWIGWLPHETVKWSGIMKLSLAF